MKPTCLAAFLCTFLGPVFALLSHPLDYWLWNSPLPQGNPLAAVTCSQSLYVAVGQLGTILTSSDGSNWVQQTSGVTNNLHDCAFANQQFVAVGSFGTILTSPDGTNWTRRTSGTPQHLNGLAFGNSTWIAVGNRNVILSSTDATDWVLRASGTVNLTNVAFGNGTFVILRSILLTSPDGVVWTPRTMPTTGAFSALAFGANQFVASRTGQIWTSLDGVSWQGHGLLEAPVAALSFGDGIWAAITAEIEPVGPALIYESANAVDWSLIASNDAPFGGLCYGAGRFVAVSDYGTVLLSEVALFSTNHPWHNPWPIAAPLPLYLFNVTHANDKYIAPGYGTVSISDDGKTWNTATGLVERDDDLDLPVELKCVAHGAGLYVASGETRRPWVSADGITWTNLLAQPGQFNDLIYTNSLFVAVGGNGGVFASSNGLTWTGQFFGSEDVFIVFRGLAYGNGRYVAVGTAYYGVSPDATNWSVAPLPIYEFHSDIAFGNGRFIAVGESGVMTTVDGTNWTKVLAGVRLQRIAYANGYFVAMGGVRDADDAEFITAYFLTSQDGLTWHRRPTAIARGFHGLAFGDGIFLAVGHRGVVIQSDPVIGLSISYGSSSPELTISGPRNRTYHIQGSDPLEGVARWHDIGARHAETIPFTFSDPSPPSDLRFYRAFLMPGESSP